MSPSGLKVAVVGGVPVYIGRTWPIIAAVVVATFGPQVLQALPELGAAGAYGVALVYAVLLLLSVMAHEAAHAVVATRAGYQVHRVVADLWGGHTAYDTAGNRPGPSALVALAGPAANGLLAVVGTTVQPLVTSDVAYLLVGAVVWTNGFVALFNLLPGLPLDGGFLVEALVWRVTGSRQRGLLVAGWCGRAVAVVAVAWVLVLPLLRGGRPSLFEVAWGGLIGAFLWAGATGAIRAGRVGSALDRITVGSVCRPVVVLAGSASAADAAGALARGGDGVRAVVLGADGQPAALVDEQALAGVPDRLRAVTPVSAAVHGQPPGWVVDTGPDASAVELVARMQQLGSGTVLVRWPDGRLAGLVEAADLEARLARPRG